MILVSTKFSIALICESNISNLLESTIRCPRPRDNDEVIIYTSISLDGINTSVTSCSLFNVISSRFHVTGSLQHHHSLRAASKQRGLRRSGQPPLHLAAAASPGFGDPLPASEDAAELLRRSEEQSGQIQGRQHRVLPRVPPCWSNAIRLES